MSSENTRLCDRCLQTIREGRGEFFEVRIEAVADPSPPDLDAYVEQNAKQISEEYADLVDALRNTSPQEAQDQVFRRVTISLCNHCFVSWIEDPTSTEA